MEATGSGAVSRQCARRDQPLSESSLDRGLVRANEGVPQPIINEGLADLTGLARRHALLHRQFQRGEPARQRPLQLSGRRSSISPGSRKAFRWRSGTPSLSTLESSAHALHPAGRPLARERHLRLSRLAFWGNGDVATFMAALDEQYGPRRRIWRISSARRSSWITCLYRAIFEGFQAHLWTKNSGRLLWMTHPSWPSNTWQIYSSDYDTAAAYYAVKKACEPLHAQLNLPDFTLSVVNISRTGRSRLSLRTRIVSLGGRLLAERVDSLSVAANSVSDWSAAARSAIR